MKARPHAAPAAALLGLLDLPAVQAATPRERGSGLSRASSAATRSAPAGGADAIIAGRGLRPAARVRPSVSVQRSPTTLRISP